MEPKDFIEAGMGNFILMKNIIAIVDSQSEPSKKLMRAAKQQGKSLDLTKGKKTHSYIILQGGYVAASMLVPSTIVRRITKPNGKRKDVIAMREGKFVRD